MNGAVFVSLHEREMLYLELNIVEYIVYDMYMSQIQGSLYLAHLARKRSHLLTNL